MAPDPNEQLALSFNAANIIEEIRSEKLPDNQRLAETFLIMLMPKGKHKLTDFWTKPETFIRKIVPFLIRFPIVHDNMMKAVARDHRLSSQAGVCGIDFAAVIAELGTSTSSSTSAHANISSDLPGPLLDPSEMEEAGVKASHVKGQKFKDQLRNNNGSANGPLPLLAIYNGLAKLVLMGD
jgi:hypothetical protein